MREPVCVGDRAFRDRLQQVVALAGAREQRARVVRPHAALRREQRPACVGVALRAGVAQQRDDALDGGEVERRRRGRAELRDFEREPCFDREPPPREGVVGIGQQSRVDGERAGVERGSRRDGVPQRAAHVEGVGERDERAHVLRERLERGGDRVAVERVDDAARERRAGADVRASVTSSRVAAMRRTIARRSPSPRTRRPTSRVRNAAGARASPARQAALVDQ